MLSVVNSEAPKRESTSEKNYLTKKVPFPLAVEIFSNLDPESLTSTCPLIDTMCHRVANDKSLWKRIKYADLPMIGPKEWSEMLGADVGRELPPLPQIVHKFINKKCPFSKTVEKIKKTHFLMLIPDTINGLPFTLNNLKNLAESRGWKFSMQLQPGLQKIFDKKIEKSYWVLVKELPDNSHEDSKYHDMSKYKNYRPAYPHEAVAAIIFNSLKNKGKICLPAFQTTAEGHMQHINIHHSCFMTYNQRQGLNLQNQLLFESGNPNTASYVIPVHPVT